MDREISLKHSEVLLTKTEDSSNETIVLFLPGISGKAFSERFQPLVNVSIEAGYPIARMDAWEGEDNVNQQTYAYYLDAITEAISYIQSLGYDHVIAVGKSFGGGLLLSLHNPAIIKKILWAPAVGFAETETVTEVKNTQLSQIENLQEIKLSPSYVSADPAEINIIHGTMDTTFPVETSRMIINSANGQMIEIPEADHSFKTPETEQALLNATRDFLIK